MWNITLYVEYYSHIILLCTRCEVRNFASQKFASGGKISLVAGTDKRAIPSVQSFFAVSIPPRCALQESE